jgi:hypothetical protein
MSREVKIDRAIYEVNDQAKSYRYLRRNPDWKKLDATLNKKNRESICGYVRIFRDGTRKRFLD